MIIILMQLCHVHVVIETLQAQRALCNFSQVRAIKYYPNIALTTVQYGTGGSFDLHHNYYAGSIQINIGCFLVTNTDDSANKNIMLYIQPIQCI